MRLVVGITGATGVIYGIRLLEALRELEVETHLILSGWAARTIQIETDYTVEQVKQLATVSYALHDQAAAISSGSFNTMGMAIVPCTMKSLAAIAHGFSDNLIHRAADVVLKERRKLVLLPRESPLHEIHLQNMLTLTRMGAVMVPPMPAFYNRPESINDLVDHTLARVLDQFGIENDLTKRWGGEPVSAS